jgi:osmotically-inducible protein OsmY
MKTKVAFTALLAIVTTCGAIACRGNQSIEGQARDVRIKAEIKSKLASQISAATLTSVEVNVTNGVVVLAGPVHSVAESGQVELVARSIPGVKDVKVDLQILAPERVVTPGGSASRPASASGG